MYFITDLLTPWCRVLLETLTGLQLVKNFPVFHGIRRFITALTSVRQLSLSWASPVQSIYPYTLIPLRSILISTHLRLDLLPSGFPTKTLYTPLSSPTRATCLAHLILLDFITRTILGEEYKLFSSSLYNLLHSPVTYITLFNYQRNTQRGFLALKPVAIFCLCIVSNGYSLPCSSVSLLVFQNDIC